MKREKEFLKNTIILFIGKFATQFISILLLPLFTHYLLTEDYGLVDLFQTYITLFVPVLILRIDSAAFRFLIDEREKEKDKDKESIITNIIFILLVGICVTLMICMLILNIFRMKYIGYVVANIIVIMISNVLLQILRGLGKNKEYSICSIITGVTTLIINIVLIMRYKFGAQSILISSIVSNIICIILVTKMTKLLQYIKIKEINSVMCKKILKYSIPMIPNALSWWIVNVSDRTMISFFIGIAANRNIYSFLQIFKYIK